MVPSRKAAGQLHHTHRITAAQGHAPARGRPVQQGKGGGGCGVAATAGPGGRAAAAGACCTRCSPLTRHPSRGTHHAAAAAAAAGRPPAAGRRAERADHRCLAAPVAPPLRSRSRVGLLEWAQRKGGGQVGRGASAQRSRLAASIAGRPGACSAIPLHPRVCRRTGSAQSKPSGRGAAPRPQTQLTCRARTVPRPHPVSDPRSITL